MPSLKELLKNDLEAKLEAENELEPPKPANTENLTTQTYRDPITGELLTEAPHAKTNP